MVDGRTYGCMLVVHGIVMEGASVDMVDTVGIKGLGRGGACAVSVARPRKLVGHMIGRQTCLTEQSQGVRITNYESRDR